MLALFNDGPGWGWGWGFENLSHVFLSLLNAFIWLLLLAVLVATLFLLIRFLLVGTRAAQLYIEKNAPRHPDAAVPGTADVTRPMPATSTESTGATRVDPDAVATEPTKPARKANPKSPPAP
ncbi:MULTISPECIES: hypothetical protein [unclassified Cryobacterium]|uniref:hypothetical protein n=1 Tax=unclassified Cryobacterium TaxID=2649013 RepID=UPI001448874E|nr:MULTISPECIES: hypothetical protein [unclassified Cryobacterium]